MFFFFSNPVNVNELKAQDVETSSKIADFVHLRHGWHYGKGSAPALSTVLRAVRVERKIRRIGIQPTDAFPDVNGDIIVSGYVQKFTVDITCHVNNLMSLAIDDDEDKVTIVSNVGEDGLNQALERLGALLWHLSVSATPGTMKSISNGSKASPLSYLLRTEALRLSTMTVGSQQVERFVPTLRASIRTLAETPQSLEYLSPPSYLIPHISIGKSLTQGMSVITMSGELLTSSSKKS